MGNFFKFALLLALFMIFLQSGWVSYSEDKDCPWPPKSEPGQDMTIKENFLSAHGITQENFSIWLKEHSVWRRQYSDELKSFTFIPQDYDTERK